MADFGNELGNSIRSSGLLSQSEELWLTHAQMF